MMIDLSRSRERARRGSLPTPRRAAAAWLTAAAVALAALAATPAPAAHAQGTCAGMLATPSAGNVCGTTETATVARQSLTMNVFKGIPYAKAPVGALRWQPPADTSWSGVLQATSFGSKCTQDSVSVMVGSEACLYLNVWMPPNATASSKLPVMVFIHGGAFVTGAGSSALYDGGYIPAIGNVVLVTINYRLGVFGFLYTDSVPGLPLHGNQGLMDQQAALRWVQKNISAFGGDPTQVTAFGESAGAMSVGLHLFDVPTSSGLFRAAIMESNPMAVEYRDTTLARQDGAGLVNSLCAVTKGNSPCALTPAWLQNATTAQVMQAEAKFEGPLASLNRLLTGGLPEGLPWTPVVDDSMVIGQPYNGYARGITPKPLMWGINHDEGMLFAGLAQAKAGFFLAPVTYRALVEAVFDPAGSTSDTANAHAVTSYKVSGVADSLPYNALNHPKLSTLDGTASALEQLINDLVFGCGNLAAANQALAAQPAQPVWAYRFQQKPFFDLYDTVSVCSVAQGNVCHANELPYVFHTFGAALRASGTPGTPTQADSVLATAMTVAWTNFAKNPANKPIPAMWQPYTNNGSLYTFSSGAGGGQMQSGLNSSANCTQLWNSLPPLNGATTLTRNRARPAQLFPDPRNPPAP